MFVYIPIITEKEGFETSVQTNPQPFLFITAKM